MVIGRERWSERVVLARVEEVPDHDANLEGLITPTIFFPGFGPANRLEERRRPNGGVREGTPGVVGGVEVVQGVPVILATSDGLAEIHVIEGVGNQVVTSVALPAPGGSHSLTPKPNVSVVFGVRRCEQDPKR